jgi:hypothetical protein
VAAGAITRGHRGSRAAGRAAGNALHIPGVLHRAKKRGSRSTNPWRTRPCSSCRAGPRRQHRICDDRCIVGADEIAEHLRTAGGEPALGAENVLLRDRDAGQRPAFRRDAGVGGSTRLGQAFLGVDGDEGIDFRVQAGDAVKMELRQFDDEICFRLPALAEFLEALADHSITFGTR